MEDALDKTELRFGQAVNIIWEDSCNLNGWQYNLLRPEVVGKLPLVTTLGYVAASGPEAVSITATLGTDGGANGIIQIPRSSIRKLLVLPKTWDAT